MTHFSFSKSFLTLSLTGLSLSSAWALNIKDVPIQHVTVYPNGALIERQVPVRAGEKLITLEGLPANFDIAALKVQRALLHKPICKGFFSDIIFK